MKIQIQLNENDYLAFQLYHSTQSKFVKYKLLRGWILLTIGSAALTVYFLLFNYKLAAATYFAVIAVAAGFFYKKFYRWRFKKQCLKNVRKTYQNRFGKTDYLEFTQHHIIASDEEGESKIKISQIEKITETSEHFFIQTSSGISIIIPKSIAETDELRKTFKNLKLKISEDLTWKWI